MSDVRALLAAERQARRISHPYLTYTKSGQLLCNVCQLNVKAETLWEGHLRSANHKKNAKAAQEASTRTLKRKVDDVEELEEDGAQVGAEAPRDLKKPKARAVSIAAGAQQVNGKAALAIEEMPPLPQKEELEKALEAIPVLAPDPQPEVELPSNASCSSSQIRKDIVDEDEWAAFEREVAPLAQEDYSAATITAAPVTAEELAAQKEEDRRKMMQSEIEAEKEEEEGRNQDEVEIMEDLEDRVKRLKEMREALRVVHPAADDTGRSDAVEEEPENAETLALGKKDGKGDDSDDEEEDDVDDWYS